MADGAMIPAHRIEPIRILAGGLMALSLTFAATLVPPGPLRAVFPAAGIAVGMFLLLFVTVRLVRRAGQARMVDYFQSFEEKAPFPVCLTDIDGKVLFCNQSARSKLGASEGAETITQLLSGVLVEPGVVLLRVLAQLDARAWAEEKVMTRAQECHVTARRLSDGAIYWRIQVKSAGAGPIMRSSTAFPSLTVGRNGSVLAMSPDMQALVGERLRNIHDALEGPMPEKSRVVTLKTPTGPKQALCIVHEGRVGRQEMFFFPIEAQSNPKETLLDGLPIAVLALDRHGRILRANTEALELLDRDAADGVAVADLFDGLGKPIDRWISDVIGGSGGNRTEFLRLSQSREERIVQITLTKMPPETDGQVLAVLSDATELKSLEAQFVQSQKMQAIGQLAGGIAHDFNNLLTAMSGHCDLLLLRHGESDPDYADLDQIRQNANRAAALVGQLLAFSRKQNLQPEVLDLEATLSDHTHLLNRLVGEKTRLELVHGADVTRIRADKRQFEQVIMNLVVNARDAMNGEGTIRIETEVAVLKAPLARDRVTVPAGEYCLITVSDEGCGIPQDKLKRVFEPFYTSKKTGEGTGLGLSTAYGIVKQSGGFIFVDSVVGVGTRFQLYFPVDHTAPAALQATPKAQKVEIGRKGEGVVLLVEDEAPVRAFASRALQLKGFTVLEASCAEEALKKLEDKDMDVDVFVTDVIMPGVDGPTWVAEALKARPDTRVLFMSGYAEERVDDLRRSIPNSSFLQKPFSLTDLTTTVAELS